MSAWSPKSSDDESLFGDTEYGLLETLMTQSTQPPIPGLYFDPISSLLPAATCDELLRHIESTYFSSKTAANQVMLFGRPDGGLPPFIDALVKQLDDLLLDKVSEHDHSILFNPCGQRRARQVILNKYLPGEGITSHVDLIKRFDDGILSVSLKSGTVMDFRLADHMVGSEGRRSIYLSPGGVMAMTGPARYDWTHGIAERTYDWVRDPDSGLWVRKDRGTRISITIRWLLPEAHIVGGLDSESELNR